MEERQKNVTINAKLLYAILPSAYLIELLLAQLCMCSISEMVQGSAEEQKS